jgi:ABC-2 type transport system ATP-binding protein
VAELLARLGLSEAADRLAKTYSGGMQRRLDVALGLIHRPQVLFLDEPTTGLDPEARAELWLEIDRLARRDEITILLTTHYLEEADRLASRVVIVDEGRVVVAGTPEELKSELQGDTLQVELADWSSGDAAAAVRHLPGISELTLDGPVLRARVENGAAAIPSLVTALERGGLRVASATIARPSLDDVYLRHAGRSLRNAENERKEVAA